MNLIYQAHSGVRYLVLLAGVVALILLVRGLLARTPYAGAARGATAAFAGLLHLQILLGVAVVVMGVWYSALMGHLVMMILAGATAGILGRWARTATDARQAHRLALAAVVASLLLVVGGIAAIGRSPLESRALTTDSR